ncbi:M23 family metallopeptidase [Anaerosalibacter sp. Marseille-P3206]|uniref:M23 family metallopeptidase n=1 Tax=Anaerosalibacter sp. Marseille-P3206 TaxID=1871005 RepID=UPI00117835DC|nr:M23 family metallopeptidase [Anaerosalibacter sp. Marseille-P3206]
MREKLRKIMGKDGFYIILFICVCIIATTSVWISRSKVNKLESEDEPIKEEDFIVVDDEGEDNEPSLEISKMEGGKLEETEEEEVSETEEEMDIVDEEEIEEEEENQEEKKVPTTETIETFAMPVQGEIINDFTNENLVYSKTLEEWTSHGGIDVEGKVGTTVKAFADGTVTEVYEDELWGIVIVIDHGNDLISKYANLSTKEMVKAGLNVKKGDPISGIGNPKGIELNEVPHLHFEVIQNGKNVDPKEYLPGY